jgi:membrane protease subunit HflK
MTHDHHTYQRALSGALLGLGAQVLLTLALLGLSFYTASPAAAAATFHAGGGLLIWLLLVVIFQQHKLERLEALEAEQLAQRHGSDSSIFETSADDLAVARRRLHRLIRFGLPLVSLLTAAYLLATGLYLAWDWRGILDRTAGLPEGVPVWLLGIAAAALSFVCFLISRYVAGMSKLEHWQLLRGGAGYLMGNAIVCGLLAVAFALLHFTMPQGLVYLTLIVPLLMLLVGLEIALNFVLDLYRPRKHGEVPRPAFDSRLLSLLTTPESIAATINEAINYQFGFEVTRSWFWQLLSRVFGWLVIFAAGVLVLMSCILVVQEHEQALVTRFGRLTTDQPMGPGLHFKLPWPISSADIYDVQRIRRIRAGSDTELKADKAILWSNLHTEDTPVNMIVAPPRDLQLGATDGADPADPEAPAAKTPSVSLVNTEVDVLYRISDLMQYIQSSDQAMSTADAETRARRDEHFTVDRMLHAIAQRETARWLYTHDIDALIGTARQAGAAELQARVQAAADLAKLGVRVTNVNLKSIHPPQTVADAFHETVAARQEKQAVIQQAEQEQIKTLATVAGSVGQAQRIVARIEALEALGPAADPKQVAAAENAVEDQLREAGGRAAAIVDAARAERWQRENVERGNAIRFEKELLAYNQSPRLYKIRGYLDVLASGMGNARKYMLIGERDNLVLRFDLKDIGTGFDSLNLQADE